MHNRRLFLKLGALTSFQWLSCKESSFNSAIVDKRRKGDPLVISTWNSGIAANEAAWSILGTRGRALDAVETGVKVAEADPSNTSVGFGGMPDRDGNITLDACIMDEVGNCGSVMCLEKIKHPVSVARKVMEESPHVFLSGEGAYTFALAHDFKPEDLATEKSKEAYAKWLETSNYSPTINVENHDTIGMLALDYDGNISGACTTSGMAFKMRGRVGDSPIIGAGLFVDNEVGAACATGLGEEIIKVAGSAIIVELMRQGISPENACKEMVDRVRRRNSDLTNKQVCFIALNKYGDHGSFAIYDGFEYALKNAMEEKLISSPSLLTLPD